MSALPPIATKKADIEIYGMSALPPKADMCGAQARVCFGPKADTQSALLGFQTNTAVRGRITLHVRELIIPFLAVERNKVADLSSFPRAIN